MIGWTVEVGGLTLGDGTPYRFTRTAGLLRPSTRGDRAERGNRHGSVGGDDVLESRAIMLGLRVRGAGQAATWALVEDLLEAWRPTASDVELDFAAPELTGGRRFYGRPGQIDDDDFENLRFGMVNCLATFEALDPLGYGAEETDTGNTGTFVINNTGTAPTDRVTITVTGNSGTPVLVNETDEGRTVRFGTTVTGTRTLDLRGRTVQQSGQDVYAELSPTSQWFELVPGNNTLTLTGAASVDVTWRPAWY